MGMYNRGKYFLKTYIFIHSLLSFHQINIMSSNFYLRYVVFLRIHSIITQNTNYHGGHLCH